MTEWTATTAVAKKKSQILFCAEGNEQLGGEREREGSGSDYFVKSSSSATCDRRPPPTRWLRFDKRRRIFWPSIRSLSFLPLRYTTRRKKKGKKELSIAIREEEANLTSSSSSSFLSPGLFPCCLSLPLLVCSVFRPLPEIKREHLLSWYSGTEGG